MFSYIVCCICPVKDGKMELGYCPGENEFHNCVPSQVVSLPALGFLFPAFDDRAANLIETMRFEVKTADVTISVAPEQSYLVETRTIDGKRYILIPAGKGLEVNDQPVDWV